MRRKVKVKFTDFECSLLINGMGMGAKNEQY